MASLLFILSVFCLSSALLTSLCLTPKTAEDDRKVYIVYMGALPSMNGYSPMSHHQNILQEVIGTSFVGDSLVRSYGRSFNGFAARLTEAEREQLAGVEGVVSIFPSRNFKLHTTRSWDFMGFSDKIKHNPEVESDIIVGVIDSGIWPESMSFTDKGFGPPPKKWKGACEGGSNFTCNNKLIGARNYVDSSSSSGSSPSARDVMGHGSHTASTAAGNEVKGVSFYGLAQGTVRGGVPSARIAAYKACDARTCMSEDILAGFDDAIADGVDIITASLGAELANPLEEDPIAIGAFRAMEKGILTVNSAGNGGPSPQTVSSVSPWVLTVAASSTDRKIVAKVVLGDGKTLVGRSINTFKLNGTRLPLVFGKTASNKCSEEETKSCFSGCIDLNMIKGKILACDRIASVADAEGAAGVLLQGDVDDAAVYSVPVSVLNTSEFESLLSYINSTKNPEGTMLKSETIEDTKAPVVASFSSRGPNLIIGDILKPDITAPGVNIIAAYSPVAPLNPDENDKRRVNYHILSGTSMSCPHVAGVAAYIKTIHPYWSPSMVKSAIMTTAWAMNASSNEEVEFAYGSGHLNPIKASDPGLVYEATRDDYLKMLCALNYTVEKIRTIIGDNSTCPQGSDKKLSVRDVNYPSMAAQVSLQSTRTSNITFSRTVTNVGTSNSTYKANVTAGPKLSIRVVPDTLSFKSLGAKKSFTLTISINRLANVGAIESASLAWSDGYHIVRSPIIVYS